MGDRRQRADRRAGVAPRPRAVRVVDGRERRDRDRSKRGPQASPLAGRIEQARSSRSGPAKAAQTGAPFGRGTVPRPLRPRRAPTRNADHSPNPSSPPSRSSRSNHVGSVTWSRTGQRRARDLIARLERMGVADAERIVRAEVAEGQPALARLAIERAIARAADGRRTGERRSRSGLGGPARRGRRARGQLEARRWGGAPDRQGAGSADRRRARLRPPHARGPADPALARAAGGPAVRARPGTYRPLYAWSPLNQSDPEYVTSTIPKPTTSSSAAGRPAHDRWFRACR